MSQIGRSIWQDNTWTVNLGVLNGSETNTPAVVKARDSGRDYNVYDTIGL